MIPLASTQPTQISVPPRIEKEVSKSAVELAFQIPNSPKFPRKSPDFRLMIDENQPRVVDYVFCREILEVVMARICEVCGKSAQVGNKVETRGKAKYLGGVGTKITTISTEPSANQG
jgi:hypothetical protein